MADRDARGRLRPVRMTFTVGLVQGGGPRTDARVDSSNGYVTPDQTDYSPFCSRSISLHLIRGLAGLVLAGWALVNFAVHPILAVGAGVLAVLAWRGCPMCWTIGFFETVARRLKAGRTSTH